MFLSRCIKQGCTRFENGYCIIVCIHQIQRVFRRVDPFADLKPGMQKSKIIPIWYKSNTKYQLISPKVLYSRMKH